MGKEFASKVDFRFVFSFFSQQWEEGRGEVFKCQPAMRRRPLPLSRGERVGLSQPGTGREVKAPSRQRCPAFCFQESRADGCSEKRAFASVIKYLSQQEVSSGIKCRQLATTEGCM